MSTTTITYNRDVDYIVADFNSATDALITYANVHYGPGTVANRLWTDFNVDSFSRSWLELVSYMADLFFFYFDARATENYLQTATLESSVKDIAAQFGFTPATASSASGNASFAFSQSGTLLRGFKVQSSNGVPFYLTTNLVASVAGTYTGTVLQGTLINDQFTAKGIQNETFNASGINVVVDSTNLNTLDISPQVTVSGNSYKLVETFIYSNGTDSPAVVDSLGNVIGGGGRVFQLKQHADGSYYVKFGDGTFGRKLNVGELVSINYRSGGGTAGNIAKTSLILADSNVSVTSVTNPADFSGGTDAQTIVQLRDIIPASLRTLERAVTQDDYSELLLINFPEVAAASAERNTTDLGVDINVYVVPTGTTITKISNNTALKNTLTNFLDLRKMVTVQFAITDAYGIDCLISLEVHISNTSSKSVITKEIQTALENFFALTTGGPNGSGLGFDGQVLIEDISSVLKTISGIDRFEFRKFTYRPRIDNKAIGLTTTYNSSTVDLFKNVSESEWLVAASGQVTATSGVVLVHNNTSASFTYSSGTGLITYTSNLLPENLLTVSPGDLFRDGTGTDFTILGVAVSNNTLFLAPGLTINNTPAPNVGGSIRKGATLSESFKVFKKINATATNLALNSISDTNMDLSVLTSVGVALTATTILDNSQTFIPNQFAGGQLYLIDAADNIWEIFGNDSDTITTGLTAVNDASVNTVTGGTYKIVPKLTSFEILFSNNIFAINYNTHNTIFSIGAQFSDIGTIGNAFEISKVQTNLGNLGVAVSPISYNVITGLMQLNNQTELSGINANDFFIDASGQVFRIIAVDNRLEPSIAYDNTHQNASVILTGSSVNSKLSQGFKVPTTAVYPVVSFNLKKEGNIAGNLIVQIVNDNGSGLPNLSSVVASTILMDASTVSQSFAKTVFGFVTPPTLIAGIQYHLVIAGDSGYNTIQKNNVVTFNNDVAAVGYSYNSTSGVIQYTSPVGLSGVSPGNFIKDKAGNLFKIISLNIVNSTVTIIDHATFVDDTPFSATAGSGSIYAKDNVYVGLDSASPSYPDGTFQTYNAIVWTNYSPSSDAIFSVEGPKSISIKSNLTPVLGNGGTISSRYYDDNNEVSFVLGISAGLPTSASDVNALGKGTVSGNPNSKVDTFIFRTSPYNDDILNLRNNEIPQLNLSDLSLQIFGGV
jgi:hypothetical protein